MGRSFGPPMEEVHVRRVTLLLVVSTILVSGAFIGTGLAAGAAGPPGQGVTATTIRIGIPYIDLSAIRKFGITLDQGNYPDAYNAVIADLNAHGGVDGRKLVPYLLAVSPVGTAPAATACTQLDGDDKVFVAIAPFEPACFLQQGVPTIAGSYQGGPASGVAPNFTLTPPQVAYDPVQLKAFAHEGVFKGKKVGIFAGQTTDEDELHVVESALSSLHVSVVATAVDAGAPGDQVAINQQANIIAQHFQSSGVDEVVAVGEGSLVWPDALQANQSTYHPPFVATNEGTIETAVLAASISPTYLRGVLTSSPVPSNYRDLAHAVRPALRPSRPQGVPVRQDHATHQPDQRFEPDLLFRRVGVHQHGALHHHRQGRRQEPLRSQLRESRLRAAQRDDPGGRVIGFVRPRPVLPAWSRHRRHLRSGQERVGLRQLGNRGVIPRKAGRPETPVLVSPSLTVIHTCPRAPGR